MIKRQIQEAMLRLASQFPIIAITGPRQSGKSTLVKVSFPNRKYITFDDKDMRELARANPKDFIAAFPNGVIIDEAQKVPEIFDALKQAADEEKYEAGKYIITGSSQFRLKENISDSLAGRVGLIQLLPFSVAEFKEAGILGKDAYDYAFRGFYPPLYDSSKHFIPEDWFENYIDTYLDLDVKDQINPSNVSAFRKFIQICATYSGQMVNYDGISRDLGLSAVTVKTWLSILEASYIIHFLEPDTNNLGKSIVKTPKLYFIDTGLLSHLLRLESKEELLLDSHKGAIVETMAISEMLKGRLNEAKKPYLTYYRDKSGLEVDTIADWKHSFAVEIKSNSDAETKLSANVRKYIERRGEGIKGRVYYLGDVTCTVNNIEYVSWKDW